MNRFRSLALVFALVLIAFSTSVRATVLTNYTHVTADRAFGPTYETYYTIEAYSGSTFVGSVTYRGNSASVTDNGNGTVTLPLADLKAIVGTADVTVTVWLEDSTGFYESTVAILD